MELDLRQILRFVRRWWWLLLLAPVLSGLSAGYVESQRDPLGSTPVYTANATLLINPVQGTGRLTYRAETYAGLALTDPVLLPVIADLDLPFTVPELKEMITVFPVLDTELLTVSVTGTEPERTAAIANAVAATFVEFMGAQGAEVAGRTSASLEDQRTDVQGEIDALRRQIRELEQSDQSDDVTESDRITALRADLEQRQQELAQLEDDLAQVNSNAAAAQPQVSMIEEASVPASADARNGGPPTVLLAAIAGLLVAVAALVIIEFLDTSVRFSTDIATLVGAPVLTTIPKLRRLRIPTERLFVTKRSHSPAAESIRLLRTNLNVELASWTPQGKIVVVSSASEGEGKSIVAANLATSMAVVGLKTVLIDADLRQPFQHRIFNVPNEVGLTDLLNRSEVARGQTIKDHHVENLYIIPSGPLPANPSDLLSMDRLEPLLEELREFADIIIIDTPPILAVSDPLVVAAHADGVLIVCWSGRTSVEALRRAARVLRQGSLRVAGVVLNGRSSQPVEGEPDTQKHNGSGPTRATEDAWPGWPPTHTSHRRAAVAVVKPVRDEARRVSDARV